MAGPAGNRDEAGGQSGGDRSGADSQNLRPGRPEVPEVSAQRDVARRDRKAARGSRKRDSSTSAAGTARRAAAGGEDGAPAGRRSIGEDAFAKRAAAGFRAGIGEH